VPSHQAARRPKLFRYAIASGRAEHDITADLRDALTPTKTQHFAAITEPRRVGSCFARLTATVDNRVLAYALRLAPYLFVRPGELRLPSGASSDFDSS